MAKILLVDDDKDLSGVVRDWLTFEHHLVETVETGERALEQLSVSQYDLIILDWTLPKASGIDILQEFRGHGGTTPILMLTGKDGVEEKMTGLDLGADDYLTKPFDMKELSARLRALLRRASGQTSNILKVGPIELDPVTRYVMNDGQEVILPPKEFALLEFLMRNPNKVFSSDALLDRVWQSDAEVAPDTVRTCVRRLRQKLGMDSEHSMLQTLHGVGYRLQSKP